MEYPRADGRAGRYLAPRCVGTDDETRAILLAAAARPALLLGGSAQAQPGLRPDARLADAGRRRRQRPARGRRRKRRGRLRAAPPSTPRLAGLEHEAVHDRDGARAARARSADPDQGLRRRPDRRRRRPPRQPLPAGRRRPGARHARLLQQLPGRPRHQPLRARGRRSAPPGSARSPAASTPTTRSSTACAASPTPATRPAPTSARSPASPSTPASPARPAPAASPPTRRSWPPRSWRARCSAAGDRRADRRSRWRQTPADAERVAMVRSPPLTADRQHHRRLLRQLLRRDADRSCSAPASAAPARPPPAPPWSRPSPARTAPASTPSTAPA